MHRRRLLAATVLGGSSAVIGGCVQNESDPVRTNGGDIATPADDTTATEPPPSTEGFEYETCHRIRIDYRWLPGPLRQEVDAALENGRYETDRLYLEEAIDTDVAYLDVEDTPYEPILDREGDRTVLELREAAAIRLPEPRRIQVTNGDDRDHEIRVLLADGDEYLVDETVALESGAESSLDAVAEFGQYELIGRVLTRDGATERYRFTVDDYNFDGYIFVSEDTIDVTQGVAELEPCPWQSSQYC